MEFTISSDQILGFCLFISSLWGLWKIIKELKKPQEDLREAVNKHGMLLNNDNERLKKVEDSNDLILQSLLVIINHDITNNGIDKMKEARDKIQTYLIER